MKERIEKLLSEILSDKYEAKVTLTFEKGGRTESRTERNLHTNKGNCLRPGA